MIELVPFNETHLTDTFRWMQNDSLKKDFLFSGEINWNGHLLWYDNFIRDNSQMIWAIYLSGKYVGNIGLKNINTHNQNAEVWIYIGESENRGKRIGTRCLLKLQEQTNFAGLGLHKLYSNVAQWNNPSKRMFINAGFSLEGIFKDEVIFHNEFVSLYHFGKII